MICVRVVTRATPQLAFRHLGTAALSKLLHLAGKRYLLTLTLPRENECSEYILRWFSGTEVSPIFSWIQDPCVSFKVTLLANTFSRRACQFGRIHYVRTAWVAHMFSARTVAPFTADGSRCAIEMPSVRIIE